MSFVVKFLIVSFPELLFHFFLFMAKLETLQMWNHFLQISLANFVAVSEKIDLSMPTLASASDVVSQYSNRLFLSNYLLNSSIPFMADSTDLIRKLARMEQY